MTTHTTTRTDLATLGRHDGEQRGYWDAKTADDVNLLLGAEDGLYHHHYGIGDFDRSVLTAPAEVREERILRELHRMETEEVRLILDELGDLPTGSRGMDAGSGRGGTSFMIAEKYGHRMDGVNYCDHHIRFAEQVARKHGWDEKVAFHFANMVKTPFEDQTFDFIVSNETTMCVDIHDAFREFARVLRPGGRYVAITWCRNDVVQDRSEASRRIDEHYLCAMHKRSTYFEALAANGLVPYRVTRHTEEALPYWELRNRSALRTGVEEPFLEGYRERSLDYLLIAAERV
ncbi:methyltransferase domain-containing protein [Streptomyces sp. NBC_00320]|uniref:SAM-dependent methyltransferase n=1 Tax=unclassified Streptomyces TaxID=2593676 RepID=UPI002253AC17|nr:methyltransferase domain-containing protein [Streptomyces sp. NBC_00320]MCX5150881.1 methyltransferase domain-containing protein [Streptomyces sp. NBC_00320]